MFWKADFSFRKLNFLLKISFSFPKSDFSFWMSDLFLWESTFFWKSNSCFWKSYFFNILLFLLKVRLFFESPNFCFINSAVFFPKFDFCFKSPIFTQLYFGKAHFLFWKSDFLSKISVSFPKSDSSFRKCDFFHNVPLFNKKSDLCLATKSPFFKVCFSPLESHLQFIQFNIYFSSNYFYQKYHL